MSERKMELQTEGITGGGGRGEDRKTDEKGKVDGRDKTGIDIGTEMGLGES